MIRQFAFAAALAAGFAASSAQAAGTYVVWGIGAKTCGAWTDAQRTDQAKSEAYQSWAHAFVTGAAFGREGIELRKDVDINAEALTKWVNAWCEANPLMTVERAAVALLEHLTTPGK
ncbi:hypothetical protein GCM10008171_10460 [Methylopila jiangsuensis]|uniref:Rap1a immunity protein domain-containing protein n=1 Tax=Methylopila jiangsuensis TaxID=586230 RepID=A0A9W6N379_9HYPH|nr:hypothetical protein [Methylopila jiangsuensis]MDR6286034.1 hypothetical protein [Methylopila jiangsuensis]GLK75792.1 hypothetical protein GCM10008171_10460 [Methylopila jiangsuensis]